MNKIVNNQLNIIFLLTVISCGRTPSDQRFKEATGIPIPIKVEVLEDEYHDMIQDFAFFYKIRLDSNDIILLTTPIRLSNYYNQSVLADNLREEYFLNDSINSVWYKTNSGYRFANRNDRTGYSAKLDTIRGILEFNEWYD